MAKDPRVSNAGAIAACNGVVDLHDAGAGAGYVEIRTGSPPADVDAAATGTLLGTCPLSDPAFGAAVDDNPGAIATANAITDDSSADATGTAGYFRSFDSDANEVTQGTCGTTDADMIMNDTSIVAAQSIAVSSWTFKHKES